MTSQDILILTFSIELFILVIDYSFNAVFNSLKDF